VCCTLSEGPRDAAVGRVPEKAGQVPAAPGYGGAIVICRSDSGYHTLFESFESATNTNCYKLQIAANCRYFLLRKNVSFSEAKLILGRTIAKLNSQVKRFLAV